MSAQALRPEPARTWESWSGSQGVAPFQWYCVVWFQGGQESAPTRGVSKQTVTIYCWLSTSAPTARPSYVMPGGGKKAVFPTMALHDHEQVRATANEQDRQKKFHQSRGSRPMFGTRPMSPCNRNYSRSRIDSPIPPGYRPSSVSPCSGMRTDSGAASTLRPGSVSPCSGTRIDSPTPYGLRPGSVSPCSGTRIDTASPTSSRPGSLSPCNRNRLGTSSPNPPRRTLSPYGKRPDSPLPFIARPTSWSPRYRKRIGKSESKESPEKEKTEPPKTKPVKTPPKAEPNSK